MYVTKKIALEGVRFFAFHGFYQEEQILGNEYLVDVVTEMETLNDDSDELGTTLNYEELFEITSSEMKNTRKLLETVASAILARIRERFPYISSARVSIRKKHLPLAGEVGNSLVEFSYHK